MAGFLDEWLVVILDDSMNQIEMGKNPMYNHFRWFAYPQ
jgi:hypothetical protein